MAGQGGRRLECSGSRQASGELQWRWHLGEPKPGGVGGTVGLALPGSSRRQGIRGRRSRLAAAAAQHVTFTRLAPRRSCRQPAAGCKDRHTWAEELVQSRGHSGKFLPGHGELACGGSGGGGSGDGGGGGGQGHLSKNSITAVSSGSQITSTTDSLGVLRL